MLRRNSMQQSASAFLMVRPAAFGFNEEAGASNAFQARPTDEDSKKVQEKAVHEFDATVKLLQDSNIVVHVFEDTVIPAKPDALFPNNWVLFSHAGEVVLFPLQPKSRRSERRDDIIDALSKIYRVREIQDLSFHEREEKFLEGTGSMVFDHLHQKIYAALSVRTNKDLLASFAAERGYEPIVFRALDSQRREVYHTNVVMCVGSEFAIVCLDALDHESGRKRVSDALTEGGRTIIPITLAQMESFAGNALEVKNQNGQRFILLSQRARCALTPHQGEALSRYGTLLSPEISTIESVGGGSIRCMLTEIFLLKK